MPTFRLDHALATERDTRKLRLLALLVIAASLVLREGSLAQTPLLPLLLLVGGYLGYTVLVDQYFLPRYPNLVLLGLMLLADTATLMLALALVGLKSPVFIFLPVMVVYYSLYLGYVGSLTAATVVSIGYAVLAATVGRGQGLGEIVSIQIPFFYMIALLTGYLASQRLREREEKRALQHLMETEASTRAVLDLVRRVQESVDPAAVAGELARLGARLARAPLCAIYQGRGQGRYELAGVAASGAPEETSLATAARRLELLYRLAPAGEVEGQAAPVSVPRVALSEVMPWAGASGEASLLALPLPSDEGAPWGVVYFAGADVGGLDERGVEALQAFAAFAGSLLGRLEVLPQAARRTARVVSDLRMTLSSLGRFREMQGRRALRVGPLQVDPAGERVTLEERPVPLSRTEFDVLYLLSEKAGVAVSPETLLHEVWGADFVAQGNVVDVCIHRLRRKLSRVQPGAGARLIRTVRGRGYMLRDLGDAGAPRVG